MKPGLLRGSRRYRRLYLRRSVRFWLMGAALCVVAAMVVIAIKFMFDKVYESRMGSIHAVSKR
jgi:hypothetical protein